MNITQYFSRLLPQLSKCVVFWYNYFSQIDSTMFHFQPNSSHHQAINMPSSVAHRLTKKNISYLEHLCTQPPLINTTAPELTAILIHLWLLLVTSISISHKLDTMQWHSTIFDIKCGWIKTSARTQCYMFRKIRWKCKNDQYFAATRVFVTQLLASKKIYCSITVLVYENCRLMTLRKIQVCERKTFYSFHMEICPIRLK